MKARLLVLTLLFALFFFQSVAAEAAKTKVLLITGGHGFDHEAFLKVFSENPVIEFKHAEHSKGTADAYDRPDLYDYDAVVLYDMPKEITDAQKARFKGLLEKGIGLLVLHHALVSYQHWPEYEQIVGGHYPEEDGKGGVITEQVGYQHDVEVPVKIVDAKHPVTAGVSDFTLKDEIYWGFRVATNNVTPLITTTQSKSGKILGWFHTEGKSRVVYLQCGHGPETYANPNYRKLVAQSIQFVARHNGSN